jgi:Big-like domain-containing protein
VLAQAIIDACRLPAPFVTIDVPFSPAAQLTAGTRYALVLDADPANLPGASVSWIQGQGSAVGETFTELLDVMPLVWQPSTAGPEAYSTYMSAGAPPVAPRDTSAVTVTAQPNPVKRYRAVTITAHVANITHPATVPAGSVRFYTDAGVSQPTAVNPSGDATMTISWPTAGDRQLAASFCPTDPVVLSSDKTATVTVSAAKTATTTALVVTPTSPVAWQDGTLTATVASAEAGAPPPTGNVQFAQEDGTPIGDPAPVDPATGTAVTHATGGVGTYLVRALYQGDDLYDPSEGDTNVTVVQASSVTTLQSSANPAAFGDAIIWLIDVSAVAPSLSIPTGTVDLTVDGIARGTFTLNDFGQVHLGVTDFSSGTHAVTIHYSGDIDYRPSDGSFSQVITAPGAATPNNAASTAAKPTTVTSPVIKPLSGAALLSALKMPKTLTVSGGAVNVGTAPNPPVRSVTAELTATGGIRAAAARAISLGRTKVTVATGQRRAIKVKLNRAGRRALRAHRSLRVAVRLTAVDTAGRTVKTTVRRTLKAPRR